MGYIEIGKQEGKLIAGGQKASGNGYFIQPTIFTDVKHEARILHEEIFGPVLAMTCAKDWKHAIDLYNDTEYGLTGSYVSQAKNASNTLWKRCIVATSILIENVQEHWLGCILWRIRSIWYGLQSGGHDYLLLFTQAKALSRAKTKGED